MGRACVPGGITRMHTAHDLRAELVDELVQFGPGDFDLDRAAGGKPLLEQAGLFGHGESAWQLSSRLLYQRDQFRRPQRIDGPHANEHLSASGDEEEVFDHRVV